MCTASKKNLKDHKDQVIIGQRPLTETQSRRSSLSRRSPRTRCTVYTLFVCDCWLRMWKEGPPHKPARRQSRGGLLYIAHQTTNRREDVRATQTLCLFVPPPPRLFLLVLSPCSSHLSSSFIFFVHTRLYILSRLSCCIYSGSIFPKNFARIESPPVRKQVTKCPSKKYSMMLISPASEARSWINKLSLSSCSYLRHF